MPATGVIERRVSHLSWDAAGQRLARGAPAILPIAAAAKQHGWHLPMNTDLVQAEWLAGEVAGAFDGLVWPALTYGHYPAFTAYAGSLSLAQETFEQVVCELADGLLVWCRSHVFLLDTGISTQAPIERAVARTREPARCHHIKIYAGPRFREEAARLIEQTYGSHADESETSLMLALAPDVVEMARAEPSPPPKGKPVPGALTPDDPSSANYSPSGSFGCPQHASLEKGEKLRVAIEADVIAAVRTALES